MMFALDAARLPSIKNSCLPEYPAAVEFAMDIQTPRESLVAYDEE